jgi:hypothetical protein
MSIAGFCFEQDEPTAPTASAPPAVVKGKDAAAEAKVASIGSGRGWRLRRARRANAADLAQYRR